MQSIESVNLLENYNPSVEKYSRQQMKETDTKRSQRDANVNVS